MAAARKRSVPYDRQVFLNCPFDDDYYPLLRAAVFSVHACEFTARIALENTGSENVRLDRLVQMIRECRLGIHDLSRVRLSSSTDLRRFNMAFECGVFFGALRFGTRAQSRPLEPFGPERRKYIQWLIGRAVSPKIKIDSLITDEALILLSDRLTTPLQFEQYLTRAFEEAYKISQKPVAAEIVEGVLVADIDALDARLMRNGYNVRSLCDLLSSKPREITAFIHRQLPPERTQQLSSQLLAVGVLL
jgi:hypothetical protein